MWTAGVERSVDLVRHPEKAISAEQAALVNSLVTNKCDTLKEGFLNNPAVVQRGLLEPEVQGRAGRAPASPIRSCRACRRSTAA
jgi:hypothetical protein